MANAPRHPPRKMQLVKDVLDMMLYGLMESSRKTWHIPRTVEHGRYHLYRVPPMILWSFPLRTEFSVEGYFPGGEASLGGPAEALPDGGRF